MESVNECNQEFEFGCLRRSPGFYRTFLVCFALVTATSSATAQTVDPAPPAVAEASDEARNSISQFRIGKGWQADLFAAEPDVANIVAFTIDDRGRFFVCETFRQEQGVTDNRSHDQTWLEHDLAAMTVEDRINYHRRLLPDAGKGYTRQDDRIRLVEDSDGDGVADRAIVYADHFNRLEDGTGAGILVIGNKVWYTNIPDLWELIDLNNDGVADRRESLQTGFGVRVAFRGHDMHGLVMGPDGRVYFSIGDRGYHLVMADGRVESSPDRGAVFRCEPDGSGLEVFATGLRNPQELAFDQFGFLFTGDNNSDSGDKARWVYVMKGSDAGWRMHYQYLPDRGPFNREKIWHPYHLEQPAHVLPPVANIGDGPSGLLYYPGTGIGNGLEDCFLMCDFRGTGITSGIRAFRSIPDGAFFRLEERSSPVWQILATDLAAGPDGWLYVSDWVNGWVGEGKGRIYRFGDPQVVKGEAACETARLIQEGMSGRTTSELVGLLGHADQRIRLNSQFELVARGAIAELCEAGTRGASLLARLHGIHGAGQYYRQRSIPANAVWIRNLLHDPEAHVRVAVARIAGDLSETTVVNDLVARLGDESAMVRAMAAISLGEIGHPPASTEMVKLLSENNDTDPALRHSAVMGLTGCFDDATFRIMLDHDSIAVRRALAVVLRRLGDDRIVELLRDDNQLVAEEAARAIFDEPFPSLYEALAKAHRRHPESDTLVSRSIQAARRMGDKTAAKTLVAIASNRAVSTAMRVQSLGTLARWNQPEKIDPVIGVWFPLPASDSLLFADDLPLLTETILQESSEPVSIALFSLLSHSKTAGAVQAIVPVIDDENHSAALRMAAIRSIPEIDQETLRQILGRVAAGPIAELRIAAMEKLCSVDPRSAREFIVAALASDDIREQQRAIQLAALAGDDPEVTGMLLEIARRDAESGPGEITLDIETTLGTLAACEDQVNKAVIEWEISRPATSWQSCLLGGNAERGRKLFYEKTALSCLRCHHVGNDGGNVGPNLSDIGLRRDRQYLLDSIVEPNKVIAEKFGLVVLLTETGETVSGIVHAETEEFIRLILVDGDMVTIQLSEIVDRRDGKSAMPEDILQHLTRHEMRDLIEYLASLKQAPVENAPESLEIR